MSEGNNRREREIESGVDLVSVRDFSVKEGGKGFSFLADFVSCRY